VKDTFGKFLTTWDCEKGEPEYKPYLLQFIYKEDDYYVVSKAGNIVPDDNHYDKNSKTLKLKYQVSEGSILKYIDKNG